MLVFLISSVAFGATCVMDSDCTTDQYCDEGACILFDGFVDACPPGETKIEGKCYEIEYECLSDLDCGLGEACSLDVCITDVNADSDNDGVPDVEDNCADVADATQVDLDRDGVGDSCDDDDDNDGVDDTADLCPRDADADQSDNDGDHIGDTCDDDDDGDGRADSDDNCPLDSNSDQADADADGLGDACDLCPYDAAPAHVDTDSDGIGNICDPDDDGDCVLDIDDNCPSMPNDDQSDINGDGRGDACDLGELDETLAVCELLDAIDSLDDEALTGCCDGSAGDPGVCEEATCLTTVCDTDPYCCDVEWDDICAEHALNAPEDCACSPLDFDYSDITYP